MSVVLLWTTQGTPAATFPRLAWETHGLQMLRAAPSCMAWGDTMPGQRIGHNITPPSSRVEMVTTPSGGIWITAQGESLMDNRDTPSYYIGYHVQETESGETWTRVATAWPYRNDQGGFTVELRAVPLSGTIVFLPSASQEKPAAR